jgi:hypothetical protein
MAITSISSRQLATNAVLTGIVRDCAMAWYINRSSSTATWELIKCALTHNGLDAVPRGADSPSSPGILFLDAIADTEMETVQALSRGGLIRILVVLLQAAISEDLWRLLAAGASEVLEWNDGMAEAVAARIARWTEVDAILQPGMD